MIKTETEYQNELVTALEAAGFAVQVHNDVGYPYVPDLSFGFAKFDGWIEIKWVNEVPKKVSDIKHFTLGQRKWLRKQAKAGSGHCYVLIGMPYSHYMFHIDAMTEENLKIPFQDLLQEQIFNANSPAGVATNLSRWMQVSAQAR